MNPLDAFDQGLTCGLLLAGVVFGLGITLRALLLDEARRYGRRERERRREGDGW